MSNEQDCTENMANGSLRELPASSTQSLMAISFYLALLHSIINTIAPFVSVAGNGFLIYALTKSNKVREVPSNFLLMSLAVSDIFIGLSVQSWLCVSSVSALLGKCSLTQNRLVGDVLFFSSYLFIYSSCFNLVVLTIERYTCITFPLRYLVIVNKDRVFHIIAGIWLTSICLRSLRVIPLLSNTTVQTITSSVFVFVTAVTIVCHLKIMKIVRRHKKQIRAREQLRPIQIPKEQDLQRAGTAFIFVAVLIVCFVPMILVRVLYLIGSSSTRRVAKVIQPFSSSILLLNSSINPYIYIYRSGDLRRRVLNVFKRKSYGQPICSHPLVVRNKLISLMSGRSTKGTERTLNRAT